LKSKGWNSGFGLQGLGFRVYGFDWGLGMEVEGAWLWVCRQIPKRDCGLGSGLRV
jgi:hypothetical protein